MYRAIVLTTLLYGCETWTVYQRHARKLKINNEEFDITKRKSKDYYSLLIKKKACFPNFAQKLKSDFNLSNEDLRKHFSCPILLLLNLTSKPFNLKYLTLYFSPIQSCSRLGTGPITCALSANRSQKRSNTFFMSVLIRICSGKMLNYVILF